MPWVGLAVDEAQVKDPNFVIMKSTGNNVMYSVYPRSSLS